MEQCASFCEVSWRLKNATVLDPSGHVAVCRNEIRPNMTNAEFLQHEKGAGCTERAPGSWANMVQMHVFATPRRVELLGASQPSLKT